MVLRRGGGGRGQRRGGGDGGVEVLRTLGQRPVGCDTNSVRTSFGAFAIASCSTGSSAPDTSAALAPLLASM